MNQMKSNVAAGAMPGEADATLRLIAGLAAPAGLADRVKAGVQRGAANRTGMVLDWPQGTGRGWMQNRWIRSAAAAAIVAVVAGGSWGVYSRVQPKQAQIAIPHVGASGGFASANAVRTPKTLDAPTVPRSAQQKSGPGQGQTKGKKASARRAGHERAVDGAR